MGDIKDLVPKALRTGTVAWLLHRITGLLLIPLVFIHIYYTVYAAYAPGSISWSGGQLFLFYELILGVGVIHALNGLRVVLIELGLGAKRHLAVIRIMFIIGFVVLVYGSQLLWNVFLG